MPLSDVDRQLVLIQIVGDIDPANGDPVSPTTQGVTGIVFANIGILWQKYASIATVSPDLRDLHVVRDAHDLVIGRLESLIDFATNNGQINVKLSQRAQIHRQQRESIAAEIAAFERYLPQQAGASVGPILAFEPVDPVVPGQMPMSWPYRNGNDPRYSGSPYWRSSRFRP